ncbi:MAG TPA: PhzF family phenazine biosynthesis isomerase, partial [Nocardioides sp.]|nr:PhzF family phenazine biosynthesis isomerase [Nocardioides sp.]
MLSFHQVDVFASSPLGGNPVAVVHDAEGIDDEQMQAFARWTNLSETTFLLPPTDPGADFRLRIFTPA